MTRPLKADNKTFNKAKDGASVNVKRIGIACSGGVDSMVMLYRAQNLSQSIFDNQLLDKTQFVVIHLNHQLRLEAPLDLELVQTKSNEFGFDFYTKNAADFPQFKKKGSIETWARDVRYAFYEKASSDYNLDEIWMAHHQDDQIETLWMRLERGTGIRGLLGIPQTRLLNNVILRRPLLQETRAEIVAWAHKHQVHWREDSSNQDLTFKRNFWRHQGRNHMNEAQAVLSQNKYEDKKQDLTLLRISQKLESIWHHIENDLDSYGNTPEELSVLNWAEILAQEDTWVYLFVQMHFENHPGFSIYWSESFIKEVKKWWIEGQKMSFPLSNQWILERFQANNGAKALKLIEKPSFSVGFAEKCMIGTSVTAVLGSKMYFLETQTNPSSEAEGFDPNGFCTLMELELEGELKGEPIVLRTRQPGDLFSPAPMRYIGRTLKKFLNEAKVPASQRFHLPLVAQGNRVLWVPGWGVSGLHQTSTPSTNKVKLKLVCQNKRKKEK